MSELFRKIKRVLRKPPKFIFERILYEIKAEMGRIWEPSYPRFITPSFLLKRLKCANIDNMWKTLGGRPYCTVIPFITGEEFEKATGDTEARILNKAAEALENKVDLLGSRLISLGDPIHWSKDYKSSFEWPQHYFRSISYTDLGKPNDVKFPWEVSRMQWMIPLGQAYLLGGGEKYAEKVKDLILSWIKDNPYACSVNWACTMDVALRLITWTWFFHVFKNSPSWQDPDFRWTFIKSLYLHGVFTARHLEKSDVNGNHYTADAAGLVFAGLFFGEEKWNQLGWTILEEEINLQIHDDGVDFEASIPYHRLVQELFFFPALYRLRQNNDVSLAYQEKLRKMAYFTACYSRLDGSSPYWGDADDARVLPFGHQDLNDHRYLIGLVGKAFGSPELMKHWSGPNSELFWTFGEAPHEKEKPENQPGSEQFQHGGFYIMRDEANHVFIDCGPIGLKGRGGHGHNDLLSFEAVLDNTPLIIDRGSYVYTSNYIERNHFRSTRSHNTPQVDGEEINRFIRPDYIWNLHNDAQSHVNQWLYDKNLTRFKGFHTGYERLQKPVKPTRSIQLNHGKSELTIEDVFEGQGKNTIEIPFHLHPSVNVEKVSENTYLLKNKGKNFVLNWESEVPWQVMVESTQVSPSYGVLENSQKFVFSYEGQMGIGLKITVSPEGKR